MPLTSCAANLAANIAQDCNNPIVAGFTGRGVLIDSSILTATYNSTNPRKVLSLSIPSTENVCAIDDLFDAPFEGTNLASGSESGLAGFTKNVGVHIPVRGADASMKIVEPLLRSRAGFVAVLERKDKCGDGSYVIIGLQSALKANSVTQDETASAGAFVATLSCNEPWAELTLCPTPSTTPTTQTQYEASKAAFETLYAKAF